MKTKILVTGSKGQLGRTIQDLYEINDDNLEFVFATKLDLDISNQLQVQDFFENHQFDYCINCAAYTNVEQAETHPEQAEKINAEGTKILAESCKHHNIILIHISTDYIFDGTSDVSYKEDSLPNPINSYGRSKLNGELAIKQILSDFFIVRTSWLYSRFGHNFLKTIISKIEDNADLKIITSQVGSPTSCDALSRFIIFLIKNNISSYGVYNFSGLGETTWFDFAREIAKHFRSYDTSKILPTESFKTLAKRPNYSVLDNQKSREIYKHNEDWKLQVQDTVNDLVNLK